MSQDPVLHIKNVNLFYNDFQAVNDASLSINKGEVFGLMGLNGAGKTTLIKSILGLRDQQSGDINILGNNKMAVESRNNLAFLPERFDPPWFLTGIEFIKFSLSLYKKSFEEAEIIKAAEKIALDKSALKRRVHTYSKGMRQKLGLLGTILTKCSLLILDEPMSGLDPEARSLVKDMIVDVKSEGSTIFLSSHILADMDEICDRVAVLHNKEILFVGAPKELKKKTGVDNLERAFLQFIEKKQAA